jgi:hypothetical protein
VKLLRVGDFEVIAAMRRFEAARFGDRDYEVTMPSKTFFGLEKWGDKVS